MTRCPAPSKPLAVAASLALLALASAQAQTAAPSAQPAAEPAKEGAMGGDGLQTACSAAIWPT
jgi:hypothetical protein